MPYLFQWVLTLLGLVLLAPLISLLCLLVSLESGAPVIYRQTRVGRRGVPFTLLKLRSMRTGSAGSQVTAAGDSRITRIGVFLRKFKLDELPQLWNVLRGDMALIGPRPEVSQYVDLHDPRWEQVLQTRPGITDLASLAFRDEERLIAKATDAEACYRQEILPRKLELNLFYQQHRTLISDLRLLWFTLIFSLFPRAFDSARVTRLVFPNQVNLPDSQPNVVIQL